MVKKIIVSYFNDVAAVLQNNKIQEIIIVNNHYQVNDIYIGVVQKVFSSINAAFIKLGKYGKSGFIHMSDIKPLMKGKKSSNIIDILSIHQLILVQVIKEPTMNKGPRLTANIHLHGKYIVLMPFCDVILISNKIYDYNERIHLYSLAVLVKPELMGLLVKSSAQGVSESVILQDLDCLVQQWYFIQKNVVAASSPFLVYKDDDLVQKIVRDFYDIDVYKIIIDSEYGLKRVCYYLKKWFFISTVVKTKLQLYSKQDCILDKFFIKQAIKEALKPKVRLIYGGYVVIESYEALTVIDVNSGSFNRPESSKDTIVKINFYAAIEIAYQLRLRNINGVIIIDFIDMYSQKDQLKLLEHFNKLLIIDDSKPQIIQLSELGLLELTRRRSGRSLQEIFYNSNAINGKYSNFFCNKSLYVNLFFDISSIHFKTSHLVNKNICSLFFSKQFCNNKSLQNKSFYHDQLLYKKYFIFIDCFYTMHFFYPKANYIVPLVFYSKLIKYRAFDNNFLLFL
uniref:Ribonuclease E n=1 Tax=Ophidocladus simpliciusculus TaxID=1261574 RepID=A0A1Z1MJ58_9FLOR|nr:ribonuclease E [Ophidocladus simpliciusculus]ARW65919.1 ribonuclease E [Ophidocladus simpliciusculus]